MYDKRIALLIPAHNEELVIERTLKAAFEAGFAPADVYVVNDGSDDMTETIARKFLKSNVLGYEKSKGKGDALKTGVNEFYLLNRYKWMCITDADTLLDRNFKLALDKSIEENKKKDILAVCGQVKTIKASWISHYRSFEYAIGHDFFKRIEGYINMVLVLPGCATCFSTKALVGINYLNIINDTFVEDYDLTIEFHYKLKGKIIYEPNMIVWTQEPLTLSTYIKQLRRWYRGWFQVAMKRLSFPPKKIDLLIYYFTFDCIILTAETLVLCVLAITRSDPHIIANMFIMDVFTIFIFSVYAAIAKSRYEIITAFPLMYFIRLLNTVLFIKAGFDVIFLNKAPLKKTTWTNTRYSITS